MPFCIGDRKVYLSTGSKNQTVNICTPTNQRKPYEKTWVIRGPDNFVDSADLAAFNTLKDLEEWLRGRGAVERVAAATQPDLSAEQPISFAAARPHVTDGAPVAVDWELEAKIIVEASIDELLLEFARHPVLHRVEHLIHARLFSLLCDRPIFGQHIPLAGGLEGTQVLHKEWPETKPRGNGRRGNFDLAVLTPDAIRRATVEQFMEGRIDPCIAIEIGLDYDRGHLAADHAKLLNSHVPYPYLVHLVRDPAYIQQEEEAVLQVVAAGRVRIGYASAVGGRRRMKLVGDDNIQDFGRQNSG